MIILTVFKQFPKNFVPSNKNLTFIIKTKVLLQYAQCYILVTIVNVSTTKRTQFRSDVCLNYACLKKSLYPRKSSYL
jgi:hypothetical protein